MSSMYNNSPIKFPCSAYSISMDLCISVNFWDTGPESIGEDMHMFLKCFFSTGGKVIIKSIYSAVSCCNIETSHNSSSEPMRFICGLLVRYEQAKRHLWGSLDTGYAIKRAILFFFAPDADNQPSVHLKHANVSKLGKDYVELNGEMSAVEARRFLCLFHRVLETHCLMGHFAIVGLVRTIMNTLGSNIQKSPSIGIFYGVPLSFEKFSAAIIFCCVVCNFMSASFYEKYYKFVGFERWALQTLSSKHSQPHKRHHRHHKQNSQNQARAQAAVLPLASTKQAIYGKFGIDNTPATVANNRLVGLATMAKHGMKFHPDHEQLQVLPLGRRPQLSSPRGVLNLIEWCLIPYAALFYFVLPQCHAQLAHLITNKLDYRVSGKPELKTSSLATLTMEQVVMSAKGLEQEQHQHSKQNQQQNHLDRKQESHQLSPPQKLGFLSEENVPYAQVVIDMGTGGSDTDSKSVTVASEESRGDEGYFEEDF
ncbi:hypothetical protein HDU84_002499 [Entophlyctis sp. JEL0112]|nr:hypothetical protein HDU84_002499 [Entophlyctis sp. JEL0112]